MLTSEQREFFENIDDLETEALKKLERATGKVQREFYEMILDFVTTLDTTGRNFDTKKQVRNLEKINRFREEALKFFRESGYAKQSREFSTTFTQVIGNLNDYFATMFVGYEVNKELSKEMRLQFVRTATEQLVKGGLKATVIEPVLDILTQNATTGGTLKDFRTQLSDFILGIPKERQGTLMRYVKQVTNDAIKEYEGTYTEAVTADLEFDWYYYSGTKRKDTRLFCCMRKGNYYRKEEIEKWGDDFKWAGMDRDTNSSNIFRKVGGYNCGHRLYPVSEEAVPKKYKTKEKPVYNTGCSARKKKADKKVK